MKINFEKELMNLINLKICGDQFLINCPFHNENSPSCFVRMDNGFFKCFGCGTGGGFLKLLAKLKNISIDDLKKIFGITKGIVNKDLLINQFDTYLEKKIEKTIENKEVKYNFKELTKEGIEYLINRKITYQSIKEFNIKYSGNIEGNWKNRIIIPIYNLKKEIVSFIGRSLGNEKPKYLFLKDSGIKGLLFNIHNIIGRKKIILVEGAFDSIYLWQNEIVSCGLLGKEFNKERANLLFQLGINEIFFMFDPDVREKNKKHIENIKIEYRNMFKIYNLDINSDPDELNLNEINKIKKLIGV